MSCFGRNASPCATSSSAPSSTRSFIESRGVRVVVELAPEPIRLEADPAGLEQVFANILSNAGKYTEAGGRIDLISEGGDGEARVRSRDTGIWIASDVLPQICDLFTQA